MVLHVIFVDLKKYTCQSFTSKVLIKKNTVKNIFSNIVLPENELLELLENVCLTKAMALVKIRDCAFISKCPR